MWHYGETVGFHTNIQRFYNDNLTVIVLCNRTDLDPGELAKKVADIYFHNKLQPCSIAQAESLEPQWLPPMPLPPRC